jgi:hypothetical protein
MSSHVFVVFAVFRGNQGANRRKTHNKVCNWSIKDSNKFIISVEANDLYYHCGNDSVFCNLSCITVNLLSFWILTFWKFFEKYKTWKRKKEIYQSCDNLFLKNIHAISFFLSLKNADLCHFLVGYSISQQIEGSWRDCIIRWPIIARYKLGKGEQLWWSMRICHCGWERGKEYGFFRNSMQAASIFHVFCGMRAQFWSLKWHVLPTILN